VLIEVVWEDKKERSKKKQILTDKEECRVEYLEREIQIRDAKKKKKSGVLALLCFACTISYRVYAI